MRKQLERTGRITFAAVILCGASGFAADDGSDIPGLLRHYDCVFLEAYALGGGDKINDGNLIHPEDNWSFDATGDGEKHVLLVEQPPFAEQHAEVPDERPAYLSPAARTRLKESRVQAHFVRKTHFLDQNRLSVKLETEVLTWDGKGKIEGVGTAPASVEHCGEIPGEVWPCFKRLLVLGRGYGRLIDDLLSCEVDEEGVASVEATGNLFGIAKDNSGEWRIRIDTKAAYLVLSAEFRKGSYVCRFESNGEYTWDERHEIPLNSGGTITFGGAPEPVWLDGYRRTTDRACLNQGLEALRNLAPGTIVKDLTVESTDNNTWTYRVGREEIE